MKPLFVAFIILILIKNTCTAQRIFTYKIDQKDYKIDEKTLNDLFGKAFNTLIERDRTESKYFHLWVDSYSNWKDQMVQGILIWETFGDRVAKSSFEGAIPREYLGWKAEGKSASGNPNRENNISQRMNLINIYLSRQLIYYSTGKVIVN